LSVSPILPPRGPAGNSLSPATQKAASPSPTVDGAASSSSDVKPLEGKTTIDDKLSIECELLCYNSLNKIAAQIAAEFSEGHSSAHVIFLDDTCRSALQVHRAFSLEVELLKHEFGRVKEAAAPELPATEGEVVQEALTPGLVTSALKASVNGARGLAGSVIDLLALFRTDTTYSGRTVTINQNSLALSLAGALTKRGHSVIYPKLLLFPTSNSASQTEKEFSSFLQSLVDARDGANDAVHSLATRVALGSQHLSELQKSRKHTHQREESNANQQIVSQQQQLIKDRLQLEDCQRWFTTLDGHFQAMIKTLNTPDAKGIVPLQLLQIAQQLLSRFSGAPTNTFFLHAEVANAGGSYRIRRNLLRTLFWSDGLSYSGGVIVSYAFVDSEAIVKISGTHYFRDPFTRFRDAWWSKSFGNSFDET
jgi:hypothetical protein